MTCRSLIRLAPPSIDLCDLPHISAHLLLKARIVPVIYKTDDDSSQCRTARTRAHVRQADGYSLTLGTTADMIEG